MFLNSKLRPVIANIRRVQLAHNRDVHSYETLLYHTAKWMSRCYKKHANTLDKVQTYWTLLVGGTYTDVCRLTTGIRSEKCVVRRFRRCAIAYLHKPR
jgi:queuine/archaeosine tRNA-ribosyltransferase